MREGLNLLMLVRRGWTPPTECGCYGWDCPPVSTDAEPVSSPATSMGILIINGHCPKEVDMLPITKRSFLIELQEVARGIREAEQALGDAADRLDAMTARCEVGFPQRSEYEGSTAPTAEPPT